MVANPTLTLTLTPPSRHPTPTALKARLGCDKHSVADYAFFHPKEVRVRVRLA